MLDLLSGPLQKRDRVSRRSILKFGALGGLGISLPMALARKQSMAESGKSRSDINCILIWTQGGTAHQDTFDPNRTLQKVSEVSSALLQPLLPVSGLPTKSLGWLRS
jgi:hypothetical protein